jgi:protein-tyrosine phosphatase
VSADRRLRWDACWNVRDLGGLPTADGGLTRQGALVRADRLSRLTGAGVRAVVEYGVRTVVDLQFPDETARAPHPFRDAAQAVRGVRYLNVPINSGRNSALDPQVFAALAGAQNRAEGYAVDVDFNSAGFARIARGVAQAPTGGVVLHCQAGRDRTGIAVALLLSLAGVPDEIIAEDYALSAPSLLEHYEHIEDETVRREVIEDMAGVSPETMLALLAHVRAAHGGTAAYLAAGGATAEELDRLRQRLRAA